ncbi:hypothetical protein B0H10DRAFT_527573 [Mycena sp. CBHHK59/15]|nr:hypothetical protein B0H10DRAFT_527573 [Mycena sp. CBHHK59/15]
MRYETTENWPRTAPAAVRRGRATTPSVHAVNRCVLAPLHVHAHANVNCPRVHSLARRPPYPSRPPCSPPTELACMHVLNLPPESNAPRPLSGAATREARRVGRRCASSHRAAQLHQTDAAPASPPAGASGARAGEQTRIEHARCRVAPARPPLRSRIEWAAVIVPVPRVARRARSGDAQRPRSGDLQPYRADAAPLCTASPAAVDLSAHRSPPGARSR